MEWQIPEPLATAKVSLVDGGSVQLRRHGNPEGRRLVISHANGLSADAYFPFWSLLMESFDIILYDLRGHGTNPPGSLIDHSVAMMALDNRRIVRAIDRHFGDKPKIGVFHSVSAAVAVLHAIEEDAYAALVLFDPVICPPGIERREKLRAIGRRMAEQASLRQPRFASREELAQAYRRSKAFARLRPGVADLLARTTLRSVPGGEGFELCCPPAHEAQVLARMYDWAVATNLETLGCPVKIIGGDPLTAPFSFLPTVDRDLIVKVGYDFIPETTHFLQLEEPEECASLVADFLATLEENPGQPSSSKA